MQDVKMQDMKQTYGHKIGMGTGCPICRTDIHMVMPVYN